MKPALNPLPCALLAALLAALIATALVTSSPAALAHGAHEPIYGGVTAEANHLSFELVARSDGARLYIMDHEEEHDASAFKGKLTVLKGREKTENLLQPAGGNQLRAPDLRLASGDKVVAALSAAGKTYTVRFVVK